MSSVEVVVPFAGACPHRARALEWVRGRYEWPVTVAAGRAEPWCKAAVVMPAIAASSADIIVMADGDVWCPSVTDSVKAVENGAPWSMPHNLVHRLTEQATEDLYAGAGWRLLPTVEPPYRGVPGGGVLVARRDTLLDCPLDPRFIGWGQEDITHAVALRALHGVEHRGTADLVHLWHPPQVRMGRKVGSVAGQELSRRYLAARRDPARVRAILQEVPPCHSQAS